jgi:hypothetical protein
MAISSLSLIMVKPANAQIPTPSVPEFTLKYIDYSYYVPPTYGIDPYTGQNKTIQQGYQVNNRTVVFTIKNQPFTPFTDANGHYIVLFYNVSYKGHYGDDWTYYSHDSLTDFFIKQSDSDYTVISFNQIPTTGQVDFRLQALIGYYTETGHPWMDVYEYNFTGQTSDWSNTQTISIPANTPLSPTSTPSSSTSMPTVTPTSVNSAPASSNLLLVITIALVVIAFLLIVIISLLLYLRKRRTA